MRYQRVLIPILIGWYLVLALGHYFNQRPLWNDEQCVLNSIVQLSPSSLFKQPLLSDQAFPRLYLWAIQQFSRPFNQNLLALRFFSLMFMIGAFFVWLKIARRVLSGPWDLALFIGCWCASMPLVYYAAELKPYSMDVLVSGVIVLFLLNQSAGADLVSARSLGRTQGPPLRKIHNFFLPWLALWSYPAIFLLFLPLYNLVRDCFEKRRWFLELSFYLGGCLLALGLVYFFDYRVSVHHLMEVFWHDYFISLHSSKEFLNTSGRGMNNLIARRFAENPRWVKVPSRIFIGLGVGYMLMAFMGQLKKDRFVLRSIVPITMVLFLMQIFLGFLRIYPFAVPRMSLFFTPLLLFMTIMALRFIYGQNKFLGIAFRVLFAAYLIFVSSGIAWDVFIKRDLGAESTLFNP